MHVVSSNLNSTAISDAIQCNIIILSSFIIIFFLCTPLLHRLFKAKRNETNTNTLFNNNTKSFWRVT